MNTDIRLLLSFRNHHKTKKLRFKLGNDAVLSYIWLLMFAAESKPDGTLDGMDADDIALAADYGGDAQEFVSVLYAVRFLDQEDGTYSIHDWEENNPWAAGFEERSQHAKKAAAARWKREKGLEIGGTKKQRLTSKNHAPSTNGQCTEHESALQGARMGNAPSPIPSPLPNPKEGASAPTFWDVAEGIGIPRSLVGKLIGQHSEGKVAEAIAACAIKRPADPKQFLVACLQDRPAKLFVPKEDSELVPFAKANGLPEPGKTETYHEYRQRLWPLVKERNARMSA